MSDSIEGNIIGLDAGLSKSIPNMADGIYADATTNLMIGGMADGDLNIISGNGRDGIFSTSLSETLIIEGNEIGTPGGNAIKVPPGDNSFSVTPFQLPFPPRPIVRLTVITGNAGFGIVTVHGGALLRRSA